MWSSDNFAELRRWHAASGHAHATVLRWFHGVGYARHDGVSVDMTEPCALPGADIEYLGGCTGRIDGRDMTPDEVRTVRRLLEQMATDAHDALSGGSTLVVVQR